MIKIVSVCIGVSEDLHELTHACTFLHKYIFTYLYVDKYTFINMTRYIRILNLNKYMTKYFDVHTGACTFRSTFKYTTALNKCPCL